jgi:hypothetical protein
MNRLVLTVVLLLITSSAFGQITSEHPVSMPEYTPVAAIQTAAIASDGDGFLGARFSSELTPLDTQPITITAPADTNIVQPRIASDGHDFLVAWSANPHFEEQTTVVVRRIPSTGAPGDSEMPLFGGSMQDLVWDGTNYDLAYSGGKPSDLAVTRIDPSGHPIATLAVSATAGDDRSASLLPTGNGTVIAAYTRDAFEPIYSGVERAFVGTLHALRARVSKPH